MANTSDIKNGMVLNHNNGLWQIVEFLHVKPGKGAAFVRTKLKNIETGKVVDHTFNAGHKIDPVRIETREHQFLYNDDEGYHFMNTDTYEQVISQTSTAPDTPVPLWSAGAELGVVPIFGKFSLFNNRLGFYDIGLTAGGVYANSQSIALPIASGGPGGTVSVFTHLFLNEWVSVNFEIRDTIYTASLQGADSRALSHAVTVSGGLGFFFPKRFKYTEPEGKPQDE